MDRIVRLRRVGLLCCHFSQNCSYYRAGWVDKNTSKAKSPFWATVQSNFLDIAVLEWLKLFGNYSDHHHWKNIVADPGSFKENMLQHCNLTSEEFANYHKDIKSYRDKFVAHLDSESTMYPPNLTNAINTTEYYYACIYKEFDHKSRLDFPENLSEFYEACFLESKKHFDQL